MFSCWNTYIQDTKQMEPLLKELDKAYIRVKTKDKVPQILDWVNYTEKQSIEELIKENGEFGLRTGTKIGNYWFCALDLDKKGWTKLFKSWQSYIKTLRGIHVYLKIKNQGESPRNGILYYDGEKIGSFLSKGRQVVGVGSINKELVKRGKWFWKLESIEELKERLKKYEIELR